MSIFGGLFGGNHQGSQSGMMGGLLNAIAAQQANAGLQTQYGKAEHRYDTDYYSPWTEGGKNALSMYQNALGLNGAAGNDAARSAFQASPGYNWQLGQGLQSIDRSAAAKGFLNSGNAATAAMGYGQGVANQDWGNWLNRLGGLQTQGLAAAGGETGRQGALAGIDTGLGDAMSGNIMNAAKNGSDMMYRGQMADAEANRQGSANLWSALLGGANLAGRFFGGGGR